MLSSEGWVSDIRLCLSRKREVEGRNTLIEVKRNGDDSMYLSLIFLLPWAENRTTMPCSSPARRNSCSGFTEKQSPSLLWRGEKMGDRGSGREGKKENKQKKTRMNENKNERKNK